MTKRKVGSKNLDSKMLDKLAASCLTADHAAVLKMQTFEENHSLPIKPQYAGFKIPYFTLDGKLDGEFFRFRYLQYQPSKGVKSLAAPPENPIRYSQPAGTPPKVYFPPLLEKSWRAVAADAEIAVVITEGELKAACACSIGVPTIGLGGVFCWTSSKLRQELLPVLEEFAWSGRVVNICFDSDAATNPMVKLAAQRLARVLTQRDARVSWTELPTASDGAKQGIDDFVLANGPDAFIKCLMSSQPFAASAALHDLNDEVAVNMSTSEIVELKTGNVMTANAFKDVVFRNHVYIEYVTGKDGTKKPVKKYAAQEWLEWPFRREVACVTYAPGNYDLITEENEYNDWARSGWSVAPAKTGTIEPWLKLFDALFDGLPESTKHWIKCWFAYPIQHPGYKMTVAMLLVGEQGAGKTMLGETMRYIYGDNYGTVDDSQLVSQFNEWQQNKQFILADEVNTGSRKREAGGKLKNMISGVTVDLNIKHRRRYTVRNCANHFFTSNHDDAMYLESNDRRMFVHHVNKTLTNYEFGAYKRWLTHEGGAARLFYYLQNEVDTSNFRPEENPPSTVAKADMTMFSRGDTENWAAELASEPDRHAASQPYDLFTTDDLLKLYDAEGRSATKVVGLSKALSAAGIPRVAHGNNTGRVNGVRASFWIVRNREMHANTGPAAAAKFYIEERAQNPVGVGAHSKFQRKDVQ